MHIAATTSNTVIADASEAAIRHRVPLCHCQSGHDRYATRRRRPEQCDTSGISFIPGLSQFEKENSRQSSVT